MITHYGLYREVVPNSPMIKTASYFELEGGHRLEWGRYWEPIHDCKTIGDARRKFAKEKGVKLSPIYDGEE